MLILKKYVVAIGLSVCFYTLQAQVPMPVKRLLKEPYMRGATFSMMLTDMDRDSVVYAYCPDLEVTPASVMKLVTTATALELLGADYRFDTALEYDGEIIDSVLQGNLYIRGSGDPTLGSRYLDKTRRDFLSSWADALKTAGIRKIEGSVISDEGCFDTEGISMKWVSEDLGSYYGAASYGITVFDNNYKLYLKTGRAGSTPELIRTEPEMKDLVFHNYLTAASVATDSTYVVGAPFSQERYLYGVVPAQKGSYVLKGDIPDPALFLSGYFTDCLRSEGIEVEGEPSCRRILSAEKNWTEDKRAGIHVTHSPDLRRIVRIVNEVSQNLYADVLLKTIGSTYTPTGVAQPAVLSSFGKGCARIRDYWQTCNLDAASLWMYDGSGLAPTSKVTARYMTDLLAYMKKRSSESDAFYLSLPLAGVDGSVRNFLKGTALEGKARLKSGSMSRVKAYAGYVNYKGKQYAVALFANNYASDGREITRALEKLLLDLFAGQPSGVKH